LAPRRTSETTTEAIHPDAVAPTLEIRSAREGFVVFDTAEEKPSCVLFRADAADLLAELMIAESRDQLQAWHPRSYP